MIGLNCTKAAPSARRAPSSGGDRPQGMDTHFEKHCVLIIDGRVLDREYLAQALFSKQLGREVVAMGSAEEWHREKAHKPPLGAVLINLGAGAVTDPSHSALIKKLAMDFSSIPVVVLADSDELGQVARSLELGARAYIPSTVGISVCVAAINLAIAGGRYVPASSVIALRHLFYSGSNNPGVLSEIFTTRQAEVVHALRQGKANKIIAYELNLRESTVKVHIRNIMCKVKATNRTEVIYKINGLSAALKTLA